MYRIIRFDPPIPCTLEANKEPSKIYAAEYYEYSSTPIWYFVVKGGNLVKLNPSGVWII